MEFSTTAFLFMFLPAVWILHTLIPRRFVGAKNALLAVAGLVFYAFLFSGVMVFSPFRKVGIPSLTCVYVLLLIASAVFNYIAGLIMGKCPRLKNAVGVIAVIADIALLVFFKYIPWLTELVNGALGLSIPVPQITFPAGISFYTFRILTYIIDVKRGKAEAQKSFIKLFPKNMRPSTLL